MVFSWTLEWKFWCAIAHSVRTGELPAQSLALNSLARPKSSSIEMICLVLLARQRTLLMGMGGRDAATSHRINRAFSNRWHNCHRHVIQS
ncbi:MAG: hypothetical protein VKL39_12395 [Leptolyngbyaceae bacterium]|nr:hypothetical protein [Leptolyngbyaceae bacterium]